MANYNNIIIIIIGTQTKKKGNCKPFFYRSIREISLYKQRQQRLKFLLNPKLQKFELVKILKIWGGNISTRRSVKQTETE